MIQRKKLMFPIALLAVLALPACSDEMITRPAAAPRTLSPVAPRLNAIVSPSDGLVAFMDGVNASLEAEGANYRVAVAEYIGSADDGQAGGTVLAKSVGNKQLSSDFVAFDPRRAWSGPVDGPTDDITYAIDRTGDAVPLGGGLTAAQTDAAIVRAMESWENVDCSGLGLVRNPDFGIDIGFAAGRNSFVFADIQHAGWRDADFAGGVLGVTFTFIWGNNVGTPPVFVPTDIDNNGKSDVAFREIYYDPIRLPATPTSAAVPWNWRDDGVANIDVESVALHEAGHGLSQAHFGTVRIKNDAITLQASPRSVMNALYSAPFRSLTGSDIGGHCSNWASWPNK
jgi:hypothetical protein